MTKCEFCNQIVIASAGVITSQGHWHINLCRNHARDAEYSILPEYFRDAGIFTVKKVHYKETK